MMRRRHSVLFLAAALLLCGGGGLLVAGLTPQAEPIINPPKGGVTAAPTKKPDAREQAEQDSRWWPVQNAESHGRRISRMKVSAMRNDSVFAPGAQMYSEFRASEKFSGPVRGMTRFVIPANPRQSVWYDNGVALSDTAAQGYSLIAGHSAYRGQRGAMYFVARMRPGQLIFVKDAAGTVTTWQMTRSLAKMHADFPQQYWGTEGQRRLVLVTCGGKTDRRGIYLQNVFVEAKPVGAAGN